jgi:predicted flap endonuclease-1-like 5' DNA nuclease
VKKKRSPNFLIGLLIGGLLALLFWYWQKSTSAEDGALDVLERLGEARRRIRELEAELAMARVDTPSRTAPMETAVIATAAPDNLEVINGIGPTYARRLREAGVKTFADLSNQAPERLRGITGL